MNRNIYRLVKNQLGFWVPVPEFVRGKTKGSAAKRSGFLTLKANARKAITRQAILPILFVITWFQTGYALADGLPTPCATCGGAAAFAAYGQAGYAKIGNTATVSQVGDKAILNWRDFNVAKGNSVIFQQVSDLLNLQLVKGANFSTLNRIWDANPSVIAGSIRAAQGQTANLMFINQNGIVFANGADIDVNSLTASSLNINNNFFIDSLFPVNNATPQFQNGLDGLPNLGGFVKVMDGAKLTAASGGRVMLIAPTVTNRGTINTPNGQAILAAGNKVFLAASSDPQLRGFLVEVDNANLAATETGAEYNTTNASIPTKVQNPNGGADIDIADSFDKLGNATNLGAITAAKGNITMVGLAVNQMNKVSATTSLQANGSIYLTAKSDILNVINGENTLDYAASTRAGRVILGEGSLTEVLPETTDTTKSKEKFTPSKVEVLGKDIIVQKDAKIKVPAGQVNFYAVTDPSKIKAIYPKFIGVDALTESSSSVLEDTRILFESGSVVDVSGLDVNVSVADNFLKIKLLGDELASSPLNRNGALRGEEVWVDLVKGSPLIANIADYQKNIERTVEYRSKDAGSVNLQSQGDVVVKPNVTFDLSGGKVNYVAGQTNETKLLGVDGKVYDIASAPNDVRYAGLANQYTRNYERWGVKEVFNRAQTVYNPGYTEGGNAGSLTLNTRQAYFAGIVDGSTHVGITQAETAQLPLTALLQIGALKFNNTAGTPVIDDYGLNQHLIIGSKPAALADGFDVNSVLSADEQANFHLNTALLGGNGFNRVAFYSNKNVTVSEKVNLVAGSSFKTAAANVVFNADVTTQSGNIEASGRTNRFDPIAVPKISVADNVTLSTAGGWINDTTGNGTQITPRFIDAGNINLTASVLSGGAVSGSIDLAEGSVLDVSGGAYRSFAGKVTTGKGGNASLNSAIINTPDALQNHFKGESLGAGGSVDVTALAVQIGGAQVSPSQFSGNLSASDILHLDAGFFKQGFANYNLTGLSGLAVAENTKITVQTNSAVLLPSASIKPTATPLNQVTQATALVDALRKPANIKLAATNIDAVTSVLSIGKDAEINTDIGSKVALSATKAVEIEGKVSAPAGEINITLNSTNVNSAVVGPADRIHLGSNAVLAATGAAKVYPNSRGANVGDVLAGGRVNISAITGYVDAEQGALIDVHGAAPVKIDIANTAGGIGQMVASDAGSVKIIGDTGVYLDNTFNAQAGGAGSKGGAAFVQIGKDDANSGKVLHVGSYADTSPAGVQETAQINQAYVDLSTLEAAGFERLTARSSDQLILEGNVSVGQSANQTATKLQSIKLDAPNIKSDGGAANLKAAVVQIGNTYVPNQASAAAPTAGAGKLAVQADLIELLGNASYSGFSQLNFSSTGELRLTGVQQAANIKSFGALNTKAAIDITAGIVTPSTLSTFDMNAIDADIRFSNAANSVLTSPLSAMGRLNISAKNIVQNGRIVAPFGTVNLKASDNLTLLADSVTSVSASPSAVLPLGNTLNGIDWFVDLDRDNIVDAGEQIKSLPTKTLKLEAKNTVINTGAKLDISGGGDLQATEFAIGPGGLTDILAPLVDSKGVAIKDANGNNTFGYYAILPSYTGIAAPANPQPDSFNLNVGQSIYLAGGNGLPAGNYTLLPSEYALLPGAYAVKLAGGVADVLPANSFTKLDGTHVVAGFMTDSRFNKNDLNNARWTGFELLSRDEVRQKSEYNITSAAQFFAKDGISALPVDAGLLQIKTANSLVLNGQLNTAAGKGGKGAAVDISADKLAILDGTSNTSGNSGEVVLDIKALNALNADSLLLGALRELDTSGSGITKLDVGASSVRMDSVAANGQPANALKGREIILAAKETVNLQRDSTIVADGSSGNAGTYSVEGNGALVRAAATDAQILHTGVVDQLIGTVSGDATASITSSKSINLDATKDNNYQGDLIFSQNGAPVKGSFSIGANRINFGDVPNTATGLVFDQNRLNSLSGLDSVSLTSYSSFDFYGSSNLGEYTAGNSNNGGYSINNLSLQGGGIRGMGTASDVVNIQAKSLQLSNASNIAGIDNSTATGNLVVKTNQLTLGDGNKAIKGFSQTTVNATEMTGQGSGKLSVDGLTTINTARISGESGAKQSIETTAALIVAQATSDAALAATKSVGANWAFKGGSINFGAPLEAHSGNVNLTATTGDVTLTSSTKLDVSAQPFAFFDQTRAPTAGSVTLTANAGNIKANAGTVINVSAAAGGDGGQLSVNASQGTVDLAAANLLGINANDASGKQGKGASVSVDTKTVADFNALNTQLNTGGFAQSRDFRLRNGDLTISQSGTSAIKASEVSIAVDAGKITVTGEINASGSNSAQGQGGQIALYANNGVALSGTANLHAEATAIGEKGGKITLATTAGSLDLQTGSKLNVSDSAGANSGEVLLRTPRTGAGAGNGVAVSALNSTITGSSNTVLEAVQTYNGVNTLTTGTSTGSTLGFTAIANDVTSFMVNKDAILVGLNKSADSTFHLKAGVEVKSTADLIVGATASDWNLYSTARAGSEPGTLTLRAANNLTFNGSLSDGFVTPLATGAIGVGDSWSYRLVAGADNAAANPLQTNNTGAGDFALAQNKLIRTGTGDIAIAAGGNFDLGKSATDNKQTGVIYTAGVQAPTLAGFNITAPVTNATLPPALSNFTQNGGDISIDVKGNINGAATNQLYSNWLFRQGKVSSTGDFNATNPQTAWWVRFDQFQQGIGALGGGNVSVKAGGDIENLSVSSATNGRMAASRPDASKLTVLGGGDVTVESGGDIAGGQFYTGKGLLTLDAGGDIKEKRIVDGKPLYTTIALGDTQASINAQGDINIQAVINPTLVAQSFTRGSSAAVPTEGILAIPVTPNALRQNFNVSGSTDIKNSVFSTYTENTAINFTSLSGDVILHNDIGSRPSATSKAGGLTGAYNGLRDATNGLRWDNAGYELSVLNIYPGSVNASAYNGDIEVNGIINTFPASKGSLELLAQKNVLINQNIVMSDADQNLVSSATGTPTATSVGLDVLIDNPQAQHALIPVHKDDKVPVRIYAVEGDIKAAENNVSVSLPKASRFIAGNDFVNLGVIGQNLNVDDVTLIKTGRDLTFSTIVNQRNNEIKLGGPGRLEIEVGRNLDLGASKGINTVGELANNALPKGGASIEIAVGVPKGVDYSGAVDRLILAINEAITQNKPISDSTLWQARWLTGKDDLGSTTTPSTLLPAVTAIKTQSAEVQREAVRSLFYQALRDTGRDYNDPDSPFVGQYDRGYNTIELLFPGVNEKNADDSSKNYDGQLKMALTSIKTNRGGDIEYMIPGGGALIGLAQISDEQLKPYSGGGQDVRTTTTLGVVTLEEGSVRGFTRDDMLVNQSRILTVGGGDILLWSSEGDLDAGKGKRTASTVPPPIIKVDPVTGNVTVELQGAATGSGIGALGANAGDVDLIAPRGTVNAGDAGVRARNVNIAAQTILNAGNISATGASTGTPVADTGALGGAIAGASGVGSDVAKNVASDVAKNAALAASNPFIKPVLPSIINVEVISIGK